MNILLLFPDANGTFSAISLLTQIGDFDTLASLMFYT